MIMPLWHKEIGMSEYRLSQIDSTLMEKTENRLIKVWLNSMSENRKLIMTKSEN